jgi:hypothetical protein
MLLAAEGVTILRVRELLTPHVFIGMVLVPPVLLKVASTGWRFARYYRGAPGLPAQGAAAVAAAPARPGRGDPHRRAAGQRRGVAPGGPSWLPLLLKVHKASFVLWFGAMTIHVLGHLGEVFRLAPRDWLRRTRRDVTGAAPRQWLIAASLVAGCHARISPAQPCGSLAGREARRVTGGIQAVPASSAPYVLGRALLPLRAFLGFTFCFAGLQKLANPGSSTPPTRPRSSPSWRPPPGAARSTR